MTERMDDMYRMRRPVSGRHPPMPREDRAAQFSPFAALTGYDALVKETARLTEERRELTEEEKLLLDRVLRKGLESGCAVAVTYFVSDVKKQGGSYRSTKGKVKYIDSVNRVLYWEEAGSIPLDAVISAELSD